LPGDSLLFTAGLLASQGSLNIFLLVFFDLVAAVAGDSVGYAFGRSVGPKIFNRPKSILFKPEYLVEAHRFFIEYGAKSVILSRFIPIVRTFVPIVAGAGAMPYRTFLINNIIGAALWTVGVTVAGFYLGRTVPNIDHYLLPIILLIIIVSVLPAIFHIFKKRRS